VTRIRFDQLAKSMLDEILSTAGEVRTQVEILGEVQAADVLFLPARDREAERKRLGLLGRMAETACLLEPFSDAPGANAALDCLTKQLTLRRNLVREARKNEHGPPEIPRLWILSAGRPMTVLTGLGFRRLAGWPRGVWTAAPLLSTYLVVLRDLPETRGTLPLRLMGSGVALRRALSELNALPREEWEPRAIVPLLLALRIQVFHNLEDPESADENIMSYLQELKTTFADWERHVFEEGMEKGMEKGLRDALPALYQARLGPMPDELREIIEATEDVSALRSWVTLFGTATADEIAAALLPDQHAPSAPR
jgi:hypothetical protein